MEKLLVGGHTAEEKQLTSLNVQSSYICTYHICLLNKNSGGAWKREGGRLSRFLSLKKLEGLERGGGGALLSIFGCKYRLICNEVSRSMWVTGFNGILCSKWFRSQRQIINWLTSLAEFTILLQLTNVSPCCFCCIVTMRNALKQFLDFPIIWSWRQF